MRVKWMYSSLAKHEWKRGEKTQHEYEYATANENQFDAKKKCKGKWKLLP